jgi:molybdopterin molybdotransferase
MRAPLKPLSEALEQLLSTVQPLRDEEKITTLHADGRVLAQAVTSELHVPPQDNSSMDGYAVCSDDLADLPATLVVSQRIAAGSVGAPLQKKTVARIFTGAPIPEGADAVVMQENCTVLEPEAADANAQPRIRVNAVPVPGQWIRRAGEDVARGDVVLAAGTRLGPAELGLAASIGMAELSVFRRPRVALFSTGDELVMPGSVAPGNMRAGAIYNSNRFFLNSLLRRLGCDVTDFGIVPDRREATIDALREAAQAHDLILTSGGVSVGEEDHIKPAVQALGHLDLWQIAIKPGKPFAHGKVGQAHFIGLPGNPVSSFVTFLMLVRPFLLNLQGVRQVAVAPLWVSAHFDWPHADKRQEFLRVRRNDQGGLDLFANQSSGVLTSAVWGDGLVDTPAGQPILYGEKVAYIPFSALLG